VRAKNLAPKTVGGLLLEKLEAQKQPAGGTSKLKTDAADLESLLFNFKWWLKKQGRYKKPTMDLYCEVLGVLAERGADLSDQESVKKVVAEQYEQKTWSASRANNAIKAYSKLLEMYGLTWDGRKPKYKDPEKDPFIPTEIELDQLISGCSKQMATFLQLLKESGARRGSFQPTMG